MTQSVADFRDVQARVRELLADVGDLLPLLPDAPYVPIADLDWQPWTPTATNFTVGTGGNAGITGRYAEIGDSVLFELAAVLGTSGFSVGGSVSFTPPVNMRALVSGTTRKPIGVAILGDAGVAAYSGKTVALGPTNITIYRLNVAGSNINEQALSSTTPFTWGAGDWITAQGMFEKA